MGVGTERCGQDKRVHHPVGSPQGGDFDRVVVLNSIAKSVIEAQRGNDADWVFVSPKTKEPYA
jgi:hypothetical protein